MSEKIITHFQALDLSIQTFFELLSMELKLWKDFERKLVISMNVMATEEKRFHMHSLFTIHQ